MLVILLLLLLIIREKKLRMGDNIMALPLPRRRQRGDQDGLKLRMPDIKLTEDHLYKIKDLVSSVKTYLPEREQILSDLYINVINVYDCCKRLNSIDETGVVHQMRDIRDERKKRIEMLKAAKPHMAEDKQELLDFSINLLELIDGLVNNWSEYMAKIKSIVENPEISQIEKLARVIEMFKPLFRDDDGKIDKFIKNLKIIDLVTKAESVISDKESKNSGNEDMVRGNSGDERERFLNNVRALMNDQQKEVFDKVINYLMSGDEQNKEGSSEKAKPLEIEEKKKENEKNEEKD